jgi:predicted nucleic acid-binding OB-fold protein
VTDDHGPCLPVESIRRLEVKAGETLVVRVPSLTSKLQLEDIKATAQANLPDGVRVLVSNGEVELFVVANADGAS